MIKSASLTKLKFIDTSGLAPGKLIDDLKNEIRLCNRDSEKIKQDIVELDQKNLKRKEKRLLIDKKN